jgi:DNA gyrase/topoisomerase IV subunit B
MRVTGATDKRGTEVHFLPDTEIFKENNEFTTRSWPSACASSPS